MAILIHFKLPQAVSGLATWLARPLSTLAPACRKPMRTLVSSSLETGCETSSRACGMPIASRKLAFLVKHPPLSHDSPSKSPRCSSFSLTEAHVGEGAPQGSADEAGVQPVHGLRARQELLPAGQHQRPPALPPGGRDAQHLRQLLQRGGDDAWRRTGATAAPGRQQHCRDKDCLE